VGKSGPLMCLRRSLTSRSLLLREIDQGRRNSSPQMVRGGCWWPCPTAIAGWLPFHQELRQGEAGMTTGSNWGPVRSWAR